MRVNEPITERETDVPDGEPLVSRTDPAGRIEFVNHVFVEVSGFTEQELIGSPHTSSATRTCRNRRSPICGRRSRLGGRGTGW